jgi:hypothetical protein
MVNVKAEAPYFARLMDIPEERIKSLNRGFFATEIRGELPGIIQVPKASIPFRQMTPAEEAALTRWMIERYGIVDPNAPPPPAPPPSHPTKSPFPEPPLIDEADKW